MDDKHGMREGTILTALRHTFDAYRCCIVQTSPHSGADNEEHSECISTIGIFQIKVFLNEGIMC